MAKTKKKGKIDNKNKIWRCDIHYTTIAADAKKSARELKNLKTSWQKHCRYCNRRIKAVTALRNLEIAHLEFNRDGGASAIAGIDAELVKLESLIGQKLVK